MTVACQKFVHSILELPATDEIYMEDRKKVWPELSAGFTVITPLRYNAPDMTPPTTRHKERGIFTTRLKNEAAHICDDHGFYSKSQNVMMISKYLCRYVL